MESAPETVIIFLVLIECRASFTDPFRCQHYKYKLQFVYRMSHFNFAIEIFIKKIVFEK